MGRKTTTTRGSHTATVPRDVTAIIDEITAAVRSWPELAHSLGLSRTAQEKMVRAFRVADAPSPAR